MAAIDLFPASSIFSRIAAAFRSPDPEPLPEHDDGARRSFILEMLDECPEVFASEEGVRGAMYYFSGRF
jgi:hypothetical protein